MEQFSLDEQESVRLLERARGLGVTVNDLLCAVAVETIDDLTGTREGFQSIWLPVNLRTSKGSNVMRANHATSIAVDLFREDRTDRKRLLKVFSTRRKQLLSQGRHVVYYRLLKRLLWFGHFFPYEKRASRLRRVFGTISADELEAVDNGLRLLLGLGDETTPAAARHPD